MTYRWVDHTAELELEIDAPTPEAVFEEALAAFGELVRRNGGEHCEVDVWLESAERPTLLADWLDYFVLLVDTAGFVPERVTELQLGETSLKAKVQGVTGNAAPLVKAVTYHDLELKEDADGWHARLVLDV